MKVKAGLILIYFCSCFSAGAQNDSLKLDHHYAFQVITDAGKLAVAPVRWHKKDWLKFLAVSGITAGAFLLDDVVADFARDNRGDVSNTVADIFEPLGRGEALMPWSPVIAWYLLGAATKNKYAKQSSLLAMESFLITALYTRVLKKSIDRERPFSEAGEAFPSGHTSSVFSVATVFAMTYSHVKWVPPVLYASAALTSLSRINDLKHWLSDVFVGFVMGYSIAQSIVIWNPINRNQQLTMNPMVYPGGFGLQFKYQIK